MQSFVLANFYNYTVVYTDCVVVIVSVALLVKCSVILASTNDDDSTNGSVLCVIIRNRMNKRLKQYM